MFLDPSDHVLTNCFFVVVFLERITGITGVPFGRTVRSSRSVGSVQLFMLFYTDTVRWALAFKGCPKSLIFIFFRISLGSFWDTPRKNKRRPLPRPQPKSVARHFILFYSKCIQKNKIKMKTPPAPTQIRFGGAPAPKHQRQLPL